MANFVEKQVKTRNRILTKKIVNTGFIKKLDSGILIAKRV
jgi:hypothetical protein